jgi:hypothetical protein
VDVANAGEEVVLDLEVQAAHVPGEQPAVAREVDGRQDLVDGQWVAILLVSGSGMGNCASSTT